jgi:hypothetical protein
LLPIKTKINYDFVIRTFDFTVNCDITYGKIIEKKKIRFDEVKGDSIPVVETDTLYQIKRDINLGKKKLIAITPSYRSINEPDDILYKTIFKTPNVEKVDSQKIENIYITCTVGFVNPYGLTKSSLNTFLTETIDISTEFFPTLILGKED